VCQCLVPLSTKCYRRRQHAIFRFQDVVQGLLKANKSFDSQVNKIGRSKSSSSETEYKSKCKRGPAAPIPTSDVRLDEVGHFAEFSEKKGKDLDAKKSLKLNV